MYLGVKEAVFVKRLERELNIAENLRVLEWIKAETIGGVGDLFRVMTKGKDEQILDCLARLMITLYVLGRRLGFDYTRLSSRVQDNLLRNIEDNHQLESWYGDLSSLLAHLEEKKR